MTIYDTLAQKNKLPIGDYYLKAKEGIIINYWNGFNWDFPCYDYSILLPVPSYNKIKGFVDDDNALQKALKEAEVKIKHLTRTVKKQYQRILELQK